MDYDRKNKMPVSTNVLLRKQVEEQSDSCDFMVKHGLWSKRYHACVVCGSSFIEAMMRYNFNEKAKGFLELKLGCVESIDMAMMFLYGEAPKLSLENVSAVIHMAEFLLIPNLKAFCMSWINKETVVAEENVETFLHLTSFFDIEMPALTKYIRQHLPELLESNQLLTLTVDTIENMFSDETLSYVTADAKIDFVMRWVEHSSDQRQSKVDKIVACIELTELTIDLLEKVERNKHFRYIQSISKTKIEDVDPMQTVLITQKPFILGEFLAFDLGRERWFQLEQPGPTRIGSAHFTFTYDDSTLCSVNWSHYLLKICLEDFKADQLFCTLVPLYPYLQFQNVYVFDKKCFVIFEQTVTITKKENVQSLSRREQRLHQLSISRGSSVQTDEFGMVYIEKPYTFQRPTLFWKAITKNAHTTYLTPLLSLNVSFEVNFVVNKAGLIAFFSKKQDFFCIYDEMSCKLLSIGIKIDTGDDVSPFKSGFVIVGRKTIRFVQSMTNHHFERIFSVYESKCLNDNNNTCTFGVVGDRWLRFRRKDNEHHEPCWEYTLDELGKVNVNDGEWKEIPLPNVYVGSLTIRRFREIRIPRSKLKCNVKCPHCERINEERLSPDITSEYTETRRTPDRNTDSDDSYEDSDDMENYCFDSDY